METKERGDQEGLSWREDGNCTVSRMEGVSWANVSNTNTGNLEREDRECQDWGLGWLEGTGGCRKVCSKGVTHLDWGRSRVVWLVAESCRPQPEGLLGGLEGTLVAAWFELRVIEHCE